MNFNLTSEKNYQKWKLGLYNLYKLTKNNFYFLRGIDKIFDYFLINFDKISHALFDERMQRRLNKINKLIDLFDKIQPPSTPLSEIKKGEVASSDCLLEQLYELSDVYRDEEGNMDEIIIDAGLIDEDIPEWTPLRTAICKFHSKFNLIEEDFSGYFNGVDIGGIIEIRYDSDDSDEDDENDD